MGDENCLSYERGRELLIALVFAALSREAGRLPLDRPDNGIVGTIMDAEHLAANRAHWDRRVESPLVAYETEEFAADPSVKSSIVLGDLAAMAPFLTNGSVDGLRLVHLQCHIAARLPS
jgi:hypothetical protein